MSKAQKQAQNKFKEAVKIAKQLRLKDPKLSHPEAVKQAFAQLSGTKKPAVKKAAKKTAKPAVKKAARPVAKKKASCTTDHRDNKSHNVNIRVMSGIDKIKNETLQEISDVEKLIKYQQKTIEALQVAFKKITDKNQKQRLRNDINILKYNFLPHNKRYLKSLKIALKKSI